MHKTSSLAFGIFQKTVCVRSCFNGLYNMLVIRCTGIYTLDGLWVGAGREEYLGRSAFQCLLPRYKGFILEP